MELNIVSFLYLFLRLAPFILVCFFSLLSIFNQDFKGLIYLIGLLFTCFIAILLSSVLTFIPAPGSPKPEICNMITIGQSEEICALPLGQVVFGFTFAYLSHSIYTNKLLKRNIPTMIFFPLLILFDMYWNSNNGCNTLIQLCVSLLIGGLCGWFWGSLIAKTKNKDLQYISGVNNDQICSAPSKTKFRCNVYRGGVIVSQFASTPKEEKK
jgi:hypothetical protein